MLDEPTSGLDPALADELIVGVLAAAGERSILIITHRVAEARPSCARHRGDAGGGADRSQLEPERFRAANRPRYRLEVGKSGCSASVAPMRKFFSGRWILPLEGRGSDDRRRLGGAGGAADGGPEPGARRAPDDEQDRSSSPRSIGLEEPARDGRVARGQRTRRNVAEALMALLRAGDSDPTAKAVARRAGSRCVSSSTISPTWTISTNSSAALLLQRQWAEMPQLSPKLSLPTRIERTAAHRAALFEETSDVRRALACRAPTCPGVGQALAAADNLFLEDLQSTFAPELSVLPATSRAEYLGAMDTGTSWEVWDRLRTTSGVPVRGARRVMSLLLESTLGPHRGRRWSRGEPSGRHLGLRSQASGSSASRRRTSSTAGAG